MNQQQPTFEYSSDPAELAEAGIQFVPIPNFQHGQTAPAQPAPKTVPVATPVVPPSPERIFRFWDGSDWAYLDPLEIQQGLTLALGGDPDSVIEATRERRPKINKTTGQQEMQPKRDDDGNPIPGTMEPVTELNYDVAYPAIKKLVTAVREVFGIPSVDRKTGQGVGQQVVRQALNDFLDFLDQKKSSTESMPTSPLPSAVPPSSVPAPSATMPASGSGSTSNDCGCS